MCVPEHGGNGKRETHTYLMMGKTRAGVWRHTQRRARARMCGSKGEQDTAAIVVPHHSAAERGLPALLWWQPHLPRVGTRTGWVVVDVKRSEEDVISLCGKGGGCERQNENWLAACGVKNRLQPRSPPPRIYNALCCGLGSFGFNCIRNPAITGVSFGSRGNRLTCDTGFWLIG